MNTGYYIYDFERGKFWNQNKHGYSSDHKEDNAGLFDYEDSMEILKSSNIVKLESEMVHITDIERLKSIKLEVGVKNKISERDLIENITSEYHKTNPYSKITDILEQNGHYLEEEHNVRSLYNDENQRFSLFFEGNKNGLNVVISRLSSGNYEVLANTITRDDKNTLDKNIKEFKKYFIAIASNKVDSFVLDMINEENCKGLVDSKEHAKALGRYFLEQCTYDSCHENGEDKSKNISPETKFFIKKSILEDNGFISRFEKEINNIINPKNIKKLKNN